MAQEFSVAFYNSARWKKFRKWYVSNVYGLCERCGEPGRILHHKILLTPENIGDPNVTMNPEHVIYLCKDCHEFVHRAHFDEDGYPVPENYHRGMSPPDVRG